MALQRLIINIKDIANFDAMQWVLLIFSLIMFLIAITIFIDCAIHKVKAKPL